MNDPRAYIAVAVGAAFGGVCRFAVGSWFVQRYGPGFPFGTLFINLSGSFLIGLVVELSQTRALGISPLVRLAIAAGVLGGYTTFSTYAYETFTLGAEGRRDLALLYGGGSVVLGVAAFYAGTIAARLVTRAA